MIKIYAALIRKGLKTIDQVPEDIRGEVRKELEKEA
ncbi:MAG: CD1375 family protein [Lachnospira sp.]|nr:CD1375 family protein [Lachnospira sp.]